MQPIISNWIIYVIEVLSNLNIVASVAFFVFFGAAIILFIARSFALIDLEYARNEEMKKYYKENVNMYKNFINISVLLIIISIVFIILIPTKEMMYLMLVNNYITPDNLNFIGGEALDLVDYIMQQINIIVNGGE